MGRYQSFCIDFYGGMDESESVPVVIVKVGKLIEAVRRQNRWGRSAAQGGL